MKRCKPGMIWVARWDYMDTCGRADLLLLSRVAPKHIESERSENERAQLLHNMQQLTGDTMHPPPEIPQRIMRQWCRGCGKRAFLHGDYCLECWDGATSEDVRITMARIHNRMEKS